MSESTEHALEYMLGGALFCMAITMMIWLHGTFLQQVQMAGRAPERLILAEQSEGC